MSHNIMIGIANGEGFTEMSRNVTWDPFRRKVSSMEMKYKTQVLCITREWARKDLTPPFRNQNQPRNPSHREAM